MTSPNVTWPPAQNLWKAFENEEDLFNALTKSTCPAPCIGKRDPEGEDWHAGCEERAQKALHILRDW